MRKWFNKIKSGVVKMKEKIDSKLLQFGRILKDDKNRLIIGLSLFGLGGSLIASVYIKVPQSQC